VTRMLPVQPQSGCLFTIGHSNHSWELFVELLKKHGIQVLVDTRSSPFSRYASQFNREEVAAALPRLGIKYLFLGHQLGGRPEGEEFYDEEGYVLYHKLAEAPHFLQGIERLEKGVRQFRVAIMCSEENPAICHRHLLVSRVVAKRGLPIQHIRGDGRLQSEDELLNTDKPAFIQGFLFDLPQEKPWRSLRPIGLRNKNKDLGDTADVMDGEEMLD
jgi:uncharacterized protein (DUF488 family)